MLTTYPELDATTIDRQGQIWWTCDVGACDAEVQIVDNQVPDGWGTSDPDDDPTQGAAQFCPKHVTKLSPVPDEVVAAPDEG